MTGKMPIWEMTEDIVVSGISGRFPESDNIDELAKNLFDNTDMITEDERRWPLGLYGLPTRAGKIKDLSKFDAQFFGVHGKQANLMDPQARLLLELTYEALCDAGINPQQWRGSRTGVYVGACVSEVEEGLAQDVSKVSGYALTGCSRSMFANRISYTFDFQGPSYAMDTACSSSFLAFQQAILGLRSGQCDQAIVGGVNICLRPVTALQFHKLGLLAHDGKCKHMDASADGYVRAEACSVVLLQKKSEAKRIYATVIHSKTNTDGYKKEGITYPSSEAQRDLMRDVCAEAGVNPLDVGYIEAHGTGTKVGDPNEINAIAEVYCTGRNGPLQIGSVKSNLGHSEPASGLCSLAKVLVAFENKNIPANLHLNTPNPNIEPLTKGLIKPITENTPYDGGLAAINSFGFGGVNVHAIVKSNNKDFGPDSFKVVEKIPRLIPVCGRVEPAVNHVLDFIEQNPSRVSREFLSILNDVAKIPASSGMNYRGYMLMKEKTDETTTFDREVTRVPEKRPLWFVFSGMGSQWPAMAKSMMNIEIFARSIHFCADILRPLGIDLLHLLLEGTEKDLDTIIAPFVTIAAVQIGLVDVLRACNIEPDGIVGHSVGELGCAYADRCFDARQMILSAYWRGKSVADHATERGLMAAVGMTWEETLKRCPPGVIPACHNSEDSVTISGAYEATKKMVADLKAENIFAREVKSCDIAFHSPYIGAIGPELKENLKSVLHTPVLRSEKWISSSVPEERWNEDSCKYSAPDYYVNNLVSPVLFHSATKHLPKNGILIEIAPHTLLQAILKRSLGADMTYVGLMKRGNDAQNVDMLLSGLGKLYNLGLNPAIENLYPKVDYPVPRGTQSVGSLIQWDHSQNWLVTQYPEYFNPSSSSDYVVKVDVADTEDEYLTGHKIDGRVLYPATGYLMLAWKMLAKIKGQFHDKIPVEFENVTIHRATLLPKTGQTKFVIRMMETSGEFSISEGGAIVATGKVFVPEDPVLKMSHIVDENLAKPSEPHVVTMNSKDIYKELRVRGYDYGETFQGLLESTDDGRVGKVKWTGNWISFADACLQMTILGKQTRALFLPVRFQSVRCDPRVLLKTVEDTKELPVVVDSRVNVCVTTGLEIRGLKANIAPRRQGAQQPTLEKYQFIPNTEDSALTIADKSEVEEYLQVCSTVAKKVLQASGKSTSGIMNGFKDAKEELIRRYLDAAPTDYALLHTLKNMADNTASSKLEDKIVKAVQKHRRDLPQDLLANVFTRERLLRPTLDLVAENVGDRINVLEVGSSPAVMHATVQSYLELSGSAVNYTLAHSTPNALSSAVTSSGIDLAEFGPDKPKLPSGADLVVYKDSTSDDLKFVADSLTGANKDAGFALAFFRNELSVPEDLIYGKGNATSKRLEEFVKFMQQSGYSLLSKRSDSKGSTTVLLRKLSTSAPSTPVVVPVTSANYKWVEDLKNKLKTETQNIWLVAQEAATNGIVGFVNCLRKEPGGNKIRCLFDASGNMPAVDFKKAPYNEILKNDLVMNVFENKTLGTYRHLSMNNVEEDGLTETEHAYLNVTTRGDLSSLKWFESQHKYFTTLQKTLKTNESLCHVYYAPLNFRDVMLATGKLPPDALPGNMALQDCILGLEFAGRDSTGKRIMGMVPAKGLATTVVVDDPDFLWPIPDNWTMEEASTVPVVYATAYYSLIVRGGLQPGESVLIHSGSGGVGQAAISICLTMGCQVFTSVGNNEKREYLKKQFPQLKDRNIANSRNTSFEQQVLRETKGRGVDIVLNSLSDEKLHASIRCLAQHGRFLEIGKYDLSQNNPIGMSVFLKNIAFHGILLDSLFVTGPNAAPAIIAQKQMVAQLIKEGIKTGAVRPLQRTVFPSDGAEEAFRFMASGNHIGKVILKVRDEEPKAVVVPSPIKVKAIARTVFHPSKTYILNGGLGGFGLELSHWMVDRGARKLILTSRTGPKEAYQQMSLKRLKSLGATVQVSKANASTADGAKKLLEEAKALGPIGGIFNLAMVLNDGVFENQTVESFNKVCEPKLDSTIHLDKLTRQSVADLEYFVAFSSVSCSRGNAGQTNYGFANSAMERICERRRRDGFHAVAIQWGAIGDVGVILEKLGGNDSVVGGTSPQRIPSCMSVLDRFLQTPYPVCSSIVRSERKAASTSSKTQTLVDVVSHILGVKNPSALHPSMTLAELGLDSLMGVEVKQALERDYDVILSMAEIRALNVHQLKEISKGNSAAVKESGNSASMQLSLSAPVLTAPTETTVKLNDVQEGAPVFFVPPLEGAFGLVEPLAKALKRPAIGLNWTANMNTMKTVEEVASHYIKLARSIQPGDALDLVGYSFGAVVAFDMSLKTKVNNLVLLDGSPTQMKAYIEQFREKLQVNDPNEQHAEVLVTFLSQLVPIDSSKARTELKSASDEESRNFKASEMYFDNGGPKCDAEDIAFAAQAFYTKIKMMHTYNSTKKFEGNVLLLRAEDVIVKNDTPVPQDYGLSEVISGESTVRSMKGNHKTFLIQNLKAIQSAVNERL